MIADRRVPESWLEVSDRTDRGRHPAHGEQVRADAGDRGRLRARGAGGRLEAAFIPGPFRFCLRCGVSYEQVRGSDFAKLATLDAGGPVVGDHADLDVDRPQPAGRPGRGPGR